MNAIRWTRRRVLAATALLLGVAAVPLDPHRGHTVRIDTRELATLVGREVDHVTATELADWIVQGRTDYRLIDLRDPAEYAAYHIPTAENVPIAQLPDAGLGRDERIVLYSEGGIHSAQAWFLLEAERYPAAYILSGGLEAWKDEVLYPVVPADSSRAARAAFERTAQVARFFGGGPRASTAGADPGTIAVLPAPAPAAPRVSAPAAPRGAGPAPARKRKEGC